MSQNFKSVDVAKPLVSICCLVYNHEKFLKQTLDSFLMQQTSFPFEVVIHDDASTDSSADIIRSYEAKHPEIFKPIYQTENQKSKFKSGMNPRFNFPRAKGKFIAVCEGDDYWTDPLKLQKQVDFLEKNTEYFFVSANSKLHLNNNLIETNLNENISIDDFITGNYLGRQSAAFLFRNTDLTDFFDYMKSYSWPMGDMLLVFWCLNKGKGKVLKDNMVYYRKHQNGLWTSVSKIKRFNKLLLFYALAFESNVNSNYTTEKYTMSIKWILNQIELLEYPKIKKQENFLLQIKKEIKKLINVK